MFVPSQIGVQQAKKILKKQPVSHHHSSHSGHIGHRTSKSRELDHIKSLQLQSSQPSNSRQKARTSGHSHPNHMETNSQSFSIQHNDITGGREESPHRASLKLTGQPSGHGVTHGAQLQIPNSRHSNNGQMQKIQQLGLPQLGHRESEKHGQSETLGIHIDAMGQKQTSVVDDIIRVATNLSMHPSEASTSSQIPRAPFSFSSLVSKDVPQPYKDKWFSKL